MVEPALQTRGPRVYDAAEGGDTLSKAAKKKEEKRERAREQAIDSRLRKQGRHAEAVRRKLDRSVRQADSGGRNHP
jgi:hypothetical protein